MVRIIKESSWAEIDKQFSRGYQRKLETIWENDEGMFSVMEQEIEKEAPSVIGIYTDMYSMKNPAYSDITKEDLSKDRQTMYRIIDKYYDLLTEDLD